MCRLLGVPHSLFSAWRAQVESLTAARRRQLADLVAAVFSDSRGTYGCRRVTAWLNRDGHACSVGLVAALMREAGQGVPALRPQAHDTARRAAVANPDLIERDFHRRGAGHAVGR